MSAPTKVIFLHGPPAVGKLTVAKALQARIPARLSDNHAAIDLAMTVIDFSAPGFWDLIHELRLDLLAAATATRVPHFITTACYHVGDEGIMADWQKVMDRHQALLLPVHLTCSPQEQAKRVVQPDRTARNKMDQVSDLTRYMAKNDYSPMPRSNCLKLDTSITSPEDTAAQIIAHFDLKSHAQ